MSELISLDNHSFLNKWRIPLLILFLSVLGSHFLDYHLYILAVFAFFLMDWKRLASKNTLFVSLFVLSVYVTWAYLDPRLIHQLELGLYIFTYGVLILLIYVLGLSIDTEQKDSRIIATRSFFYLLFAFFLSYTLFVAWSFFSIPQGTLSGTGMYVCFPNPYQRALVNEGRLISTILAYYLTTVTLLLPLVALYFSTFRKKGFYILELLFIASAALFALYISSLMGRRTVFLLFALGVVVLLGVRFLSLRVNIKKVLLFSVTALALIYGLYTFVLSHKASPKFQGMLINSGIVIPLTGTPEPSLLEEVQKTPVIQKLTHKGLQDSRFGWWPSAFHIMMEHPFGGGHDIHVAPGIHLAHNTWLDIGKAFGIIPFVLLVGITLLHLYYLVRILFSHRIENFLKYLLILIALGVLPIMMVEPVFNSDKTFFVYIFFYFGIVANLHTRLKTV